MNKREAAIVTAYTGYLIGDFHEAHLYIEKIMNRPVFTHEVANAETFKEIQKRAKKDFCSIKIKD